MAKEQSTNSRFKQRPGAMPVRTVNRGFIPERRKRRQDSNRSSS